MKFSEVQKIALRHLSKYPDEWRNDTPVTQKCLNVLCYDRDVIRVAFEPDIGFCEMITSEKVEEIRKLIDESN